MNGISDLLQVLAAQELAPSDGSMRDGWRGYLRGRENAGRRSRVAFQAALSPGHRGQGLNFDLERWLDEYEDNHEEETE